MLKYSFGGIAMIYNLDLFGKKLKEIRKNLCLDQKEITKLSGINDATIRRLENGKVLPKLDTLELLSPIYKEDLISLLLQYRFDDYSVFYDIDNRIESKLANGEFHTLTNEFKELDILLSSTKNPYYINLIEQLILLSKAIIQYRDNNYYYDLALKNLIRAIRITTPTFSLESYDSFVYSSMETRVIMNIAFVLNKLNNKEKYLELLKFCIDSVDYDNMIYPKLCHNLSGAYYRNNNFNKALEYSNMGIESSRRSGNLYGLSLLYYGKGLAEYKLNKEEHIDSLITSVYLCKALGQENLRNTIINTCKKNFGIDL